MDLPIFPTSRILTPIVKKMIFHIYGATMTDGATVIQGALKSQAYHDVKGAKRAAWEHSLGPVSFITTDALMNINHGYKVKVQHCKLCPRVARVFMPLHFLFHLNLHSDVFCTLLHLR